MAFPMLKPSLTCHYQGVLHLDLPYFHTVMLCLHSETITHVLCFHYTQIVLVSKRGHKTQRVHLLKDLVIHMKYWKEAEDSENWGRNRKLACNLHQPMVACGRILLKNLWNRGTVCHFMFSTATSWDTVLRKHMFHISGPFWGTIQSCTIFSTGISQLLYKDSVICNFCHILGNLLS